MILFKVIGSIQEDQKHNVSRVNCDWSTNNKIIYLWWKLICRSVGHRFDALKHSHWLGYPLGHHLWYKTLILWVILQILCHCEVFFFNDPVSLRAEEQRRKGVPCSCAPPPTPPLSLQPAAHQLQWNSDSSQKMATILNRFFS